MSDFSSLLLYLITYAVSAFLISRWNNKSSRLYAVLGFVPPVILAAERYWVGTDFGLYLHYFERDGNLSYGEIFNNFYSEGGFHSISHIGSTFDSLPLYFGTCATITLVPVIWTYYREYRGKLIGIFAFIYLLTFFSQSLNIMRQGIAIALTFIASYYIFKRDLKMFLLFIGIAMTFHLSAAIFLPSYYFYSDSKKISYKQWFVVAVTLLCLLYGTALISSLSGIEGFEKYGVYGDEDERAQNRSIILTVFLLVIFFMRRRKINNVDPRGNTLLIFFIVSFIIELTGFTNPAIKRSALYFNLYCLPLSCLWIRSFPKNSQMWAKLLIVGFFLVRFVVAFYILGQSNLIPYNTIESI